MSRRRIAFWLVALGIVLGVGLGGAVLAVGLALSAPRSTAIGPPPTDLPGAEAVVIPSGSGSRLSGWWVPGTVPHGGAVVLLHGVWESRLRMVPRARVLHQHGFSVLLVDLQAHGQSPGRRITFGKLEALDAVAAVSFVRNRVPAERVGIDGVSLGGAAAVLGSETEPVDALVAESVYPDIDAALANRLRAGLGRVAGPLVTPLLAPIFETLLPPILGVTPDELRPIDHVGAVGAPILIASGTDDDRTPPDETQALFDRAAEPKDLWLVSGAAHVDLERYGPADYWAHILPFFHEHLQR